MFYRKLYIRIRLFFQSIQEILNSIFVFSMIIIAVYLFLNNYIVKTVIVGKANYERLNNRYENAVKIYNVAYFYYRINHFSENNKKIYLEIPYQTALCYINEHDRGKAIKSMLNGLVSVQNEYGMLSNEAAYFTRNYLINFYLINDNYSLAAKEFSNLIIIYRAVGYGGNEIADITRLKGDIAYQKKQYDIAMKFYNEALESLSSGENINYNIISKIVRRTCDYDIKNKRYDVAINRYKKAITLMKNSGKNQRELTAQLFVKLGDTYSLNKYNIKKAISSYEEAIKIMESLPSTTYSKQNIKTYLTTLKGLYYEGREYVKSREVDIKLARKRRFSFM